jgi:hypothetical protein
VAYTETYVDTAHASASNLNAGSTNGAPLVTSTGGNWDGTSLFTATDAPDLSGVTVGMFAAVYASGATVAAFVGRITAVDNTAKTVTLSTTAKSGTAPGSATGTMALRVGGVWKGPNGAVGFPYNFAAGAMTDGTNPLRVNIRNTATYNVTAGVVHSLVGPVTFQGYTTTPGDGGRATIDGGTASNFSVLTLSGGATTVVDLTFARGGTTATGGVGVVLISGAEISLGRVRATGGAGIGMFLSGQGLVFDECEVDGNGGFSTLFGGIYCSSSAGSGLVFNRCFVHDTTVGNGFAFGGGSPTLIDCVADANAGAGLLTTSLGLPFLKGCAFVNNAGDGVKITAASGPGMRIESCVFGNNTGSHINSGGTQPAGRVLVTTSGTFGTGTPVGGTTQSAVQYRTSSAVDLIAFTASPFAGIGTGAPGSTRTGDFSTTLAAAKNAGRGTFLQLANYSTTTTARPDIGPAQHLDSGGSGGVSRSRVVGGA